MQTKKKNFLISIEILITFSLLITAIVLFTQSNRQQRILVRSQAQVKSFINKNTILFEEYSLTFNNSALNQTRKAYQDNTNNIKIISPNLETSREKDGKYYIYKGHHKKNNYYNLFKIKAAYFKKFSKHIEANVIFNDFISRGLTMYTSYGPKDLWLNALKRAAKNKAKFRETKKYFCFLSKMKDSKLKLYINKKTYLPDQLTMNIKSKKMWHSSPYKKVTLKVIKRKKLAANKNIFKLKIPAKYKRKKLILVKDAEEFNEEEIEEEGCNFCHFKNLTLYHFSKP